MKKDFLKFNYYIISFTLLFFLLNINKVYAHISDYFVEEIKRKGELSINDGSTTFIFKKDGTVKAYPSDISSAPYGLSIDGVWYARTPIIIFGKWDLYKSTGDNDIKYKKMKLYVAPIDKDKEGNYKFYSFPDELVNISKEEFDMHKTHLGFSRYRIMKSYFYFADKTHKVITLNGKQQYLINNLKNEKDTITEVINKNKIEKKGANNFCGIMELGYTKSEKGKFGQNGEYNHYVNIIDILEIEFFDKAKLACEKFIDNWLEG